MTEPQNDDHGRTVIEGTFANTPLLRVRAAWRIAIATFVVVAFALAVVPAIF